MKYTAVLLDLDGTVYQGSRAIEGAAKTIKMLKEKGVRIYYITNSSTKSRNEIVKILEGLGIPAQKKEVYSSGYITSCYIREKFPGKTVLCLSSGGMQEELREQGIEIKTDEHADIVTIGLDRTLTYEKLVKAHRAIEAGAFFIASNKDHKFPVEDGFLPGAGSLVTALEYSTGKKAFSIGKPSKQFMQFILKHEKLLPKECLIVGDNMETDIKLGIASKVDTALVLSGVTHKKHLKNHSKKPTFILSSINDLLKIITS